MNIAGTASPSAAGTAYSRKGGKKSAPERAVAASFADTLTNETEAAAKNDRLIMSSAAVSGNTVNQSNVGFAPQRRLYSRVHFRRRIRGNEK